MAITVFEINSKGRINNDDMEFSVVASLGKNGDWKMLQSILFYIMIDNCVGYWNNKRMFKYPLNKKLRLTYYSKGKETHFRYSLVENDKKINLKNQTI